MTDSLTTTMTTIDPSTEPFLFGRFAPVHDEISIDRLTVIGAVPSDLEGAYLRNGPNPAFTPLGSYTYPLEGDGMIHGVWLEGGRARYANRFVRTQSLLAEERAGRALFGGLLTPAFVDPGLLGPDPDPGWPNKLDAFINIVRHAGRYLALEEGTPPYEIDADLETVGRFDFAGRLTAGMCAHPKVDPSTGEMIVFHYDIQAPFLTWSTIGADGNVTQPAIPVEGVDEGYMIHDFAITEHCVVVVIGPLRLDLDAAMAGRSPLSWEPERGTRIAIIARDRASATRWVHADPFWAWHYANAFEDGDVVHLDLPYSSAPTMLLPPSQRSAKRSGFARVTLRPASGDLTIDVLDERGCEFPRIDDRLVGQRHRYVTVAARSETAVLQAGEHDVVRRHDMQSGASVELETGAAIGEVTFAPRAHNADELDGYYLAFGTDLATGASGLYIWDAAEFPSAPTAIIRTPRRIPNGLHGNWFSSTA